jgi:hypothetical protein
MEKEAIPRKMEGLLAGSRLMGQLRGLACRRPHYRIQGPPSSPYKQLDCRVNNSNPLLHHQYQQPTARSLLPLRKVPRAVPTSIP